MGKLPRQQKEGSKGSDNSDLCEQWAQNMLTEQENMQTWWSF